MAAWRAARPGAGRRGAAAGRGWERQDATLRRAENDPLSPQPQTLSLSPGAGSAFAARSGLHPPARTPRSLAIRRRRIHPAASLHFNYRHINIHEPGLEGTAGCHFPRPRTPPPHPSSPAESWIVPSLSQPRLRQQLVHSRSGVHECERVWVLVSMGKGASGATGTQGGELCVNVYECVYVPICNCLCECVACVSMCPCAHVCPCVNVSVCTVHVCMGMCVCVSLGNPRNCVRTSGLGLGNGQGCLG